MKMIIGEYEFKSKWETDCQDKQDFDFPILHVSTRYWGRDSTAKPTIYLGETKLIEHEGYIEGKDEAETKQLTEEWIRVEVEKLIKKIAN